eukprot:Colp12_sorted_trinity150504_noHs@28627
MPGVVQQVKRPEDIRNLTDVTKDFPRDFYQVDQFKAWSSVFQAFAQTALGIYLVHISTPFWLPFAWFFAGTAAVGLFVIGHECAHGSFSNSKLINFIVGTAVFAPLAWPYNSWLLTHNHHHAHTNNLQRDHLWKPLRPTIDKSNVLTRWFLYLFYVGPFFFEASILHHLTNILFPAFPKKRWGMVLLSDFFALGTLALIANYLFTMGGTWAFCKYWVIPYLIFNFWLSFYTYFHHRSPEITWKEDENWNKAQAQLFDTAHVDYPAIIDWLHFDIAWHVPHHVSVKIPWYNLRRATYFLMSRYPLKTYTMSWKHYWDTVNNCHIHSDEQTYKRLNLGVAASKEAAPSKASKKAL